VGGISQCLESGHPGLLLVSVQPTHMPGIALVLFKFSVEMFGIF